MPAVSKQSPRPDSRPRTTVKPGSILSQAIDVSELVSQWLKVCIYGENRVGKTYLACQFPKPLLLLAFEPNETGGAITVRKMKGIKYLRMKNVQPLTQLVQELKDGVTCDLPGFEGKLYQSIVIDSATSLQDIILQEILGLSSPMEINSFGRVTRDQYFERSDKTRECLRLLLNLPMNTVVTAKQKDHNRQEKDKPRMLGQLELQSFFGASLGTETAGWLHDACDYICRLYIEKEVIVTEKPAILNGKQVMEDGKPKMTRMERETGKFVRRLQTIYHPNFAGGFRSDRPEIVPEFIQEPTYEKFAKIVRGEKL
jgi:hypothetical protein